MTLQDTTLAHFRRTGLLALEPSAFGLAFPIWLAPPQPFELVAGGAAAVVDVAGPLTYDGVCTDSYRSIRARFEAALASDAQTVIVRYRSPGGEVSGAFDCARALPRLAKAAGKKYLAFTESQCQSAAYALACGADRIVISDTAHVGSIGVISVAVETTKADAAAGLHFEIFASGERKADGNPHQEWTAAARESAQAGIDESAEIFFDLVQQARGIAKPSALQGASFMGATAKARGLCDAVMSWDALVESLGGGSGAGAIQSAITGDLAPQLSKSSMPFPDKKDDEKKDDAKAWRKALAKAADDGDEDAKKALSALDAKSPAKAEGDDKDKGKAAKSEGDEPEKKDEEKKDAKKAAAPAIPASAAADPLVAGLLAQVQELAAAQAARDARDEAAARAAFMATRPDLNAELVKALAGKPLAEVQAIVNAIPKASNPLVPVLEGSVPRGGGPLALSHNPDLDRRMGITAGYQTGVINTDVTQVFGVPVPAAEGSNK